jgi:hypothetical protein
MPTIIVDTEQAALIEAACAMLEAALTARVKRVDPDKVISNSLALQSNKLATVRQLLKMPDAPRWTGLDIALKQKASRAMAVLLSNSPDQACDKSWDTLRGVIVAPAYPQD